MHGNIVLLAFYALGVLAKPSFDTRSIQDLTDRAACAQGDAITCKYCQPPPDADKKCVAWEARFDHVPAGKPVGSNPPREDGWFFSYPNVVDPMALSNIVPKSSPHAAYSSKGSFEMELNTENNLFGRLIQLYFACAHAGAPVKCVMYLTATCYKDTHRKSAYEFSAQYNYIPQGSPASMEYVNWTVVEQNKGGANPQQCYDYFMQASASSGPTPALYLDNIVFTSTYYKG